MTESEVIDWVRQHRMDWLSRRLRQVRELPTTVRESFTQYCWYLYVAELAVTASSFDLEDLTPGVLLALAKATQEPTRPMMQTHDEMLMEIPIGDMHGAGLIIWNAACADQDPLVAVWTGGLKRIVPPR